MYIIIFPFLFLNIYNLPVLLVMTSVNRQRVRLFVQWHTHTQQLGSMNRFFTPDGVQWRRPVLPRARSWAGGRAGAGPAKDITCGDTFGLSFFFLSISGSASALWKTRSWYSILQRSVFWANFMNSPNLIHPSLPANLTAASSRSGSGLETA